MYIYVRVCVCVCVCELAHARVCVCVLGEFLYRMFLNEGKMLLKYINIFKQKAMAI